jgi:hypothetical protein
MKTLRKIAIILVLLVLSNSQMSFAQKSQAAVKLARVKYSGGGDWYNDPSSEINLLKFVQQNTNIQVDPVYEYVDLASDNLFLYPLIFLTGHGNLNFSEQEVSRLRAYLENGGFLYIDDDYGLDKYIRKEIKKIFPEKEFQELPYSHSIYNIHFKFPNGVPKNHEHDDKAPQGLGLFHEGRLCVFYTVESNPSDGWADPDVHNDSAEKRLEALKFGANIIIYALSN